MESLERLIGETNLDPASCALRHLTRTSRLIVASFDAAFSPLNLTGHQFNLLMTLARSGPMTVNYLAAVVGTHPSTIPRLIAPLKRRGLVRSQVGTDRRERLIASTRKASGLLLRAFPRWAETQRKIVSQLGDKEWSLTMAGLEKLRKSPEIGDRGAR